MKYEDWKKYRDAEEAEMVDQAWKQAERWMCKLFGGERDWEHPEECRKTGMWAPESKYRKQIPKWLEGMMLQAERQATEAQFPLVVIFEHQRPRMQSLVVVRLQDFYDWFISGPNEAPDEEDEDVHAGTSPLPGFEHLV